MDGKIHTTIGKVSLILGMLSVLLIILQVIVTYAVYSGIIAFDIAIVLSYLGYLSIPFAIIAIILGYLARKQGDKYGLIGLILGLIVIILFIISIVMSAAVYLYVNNMTPGPSTNIGPMLFLNMHQNALASDGWVNWTIDNASSAGTIGVKWSDLRISVGGVNFGAPTETMQPAIGHCGYNGALDEGGKLYIHGTTEQIIAGLNLIVSYEVSYKTPISSWGSSGTAFHETIE